MKTNLLWFLLTLTATDCFSQGNYVFSGSELVNAGSLDLATPGGQTWQTDRSAAPGYFSVLAGGSITGSSDAANVDGYVKKYGAEAFTFPVGSGVQLRSLSISAPSNAADAFAAAWIDGDPGIAADPTNPNSGTHSTAAVGAGILTVSNAGEWDWQDFNNDGAGLTITVSIPDMSSFALKDNLRLVGWLGGVWVDLSGGPSASGNIANSTLTGTMVNGVTAIAIGSVAVTLPLSFTVFTATEKDCNASLAWATTAEASSDHFDVEKSTDGFTFTKTAIVMATNTAGTNAYHFTATKNDESVIYYRIKAVDKDGSFIYSSVRKLAFTCNNTGNSLKIYPNPATADPGLVTIACKSNYRGNALMQITDNSGRIIISRLVLIGNGENKYAVSISGMASGIYYAMLMDANGTAIGSAQKFIKQ